MQPGDAAVSDPAAPYADGSGQMAAPNVDLADEIIAQQIAQIEFASNAQVVRVIRR